jgi:hypothetical protein
MQDLETESLWSQISGEAIMGIEEGKKLTLFPVIHTTYAEFKKNYPHGVLLTKPEKGPPGSPYETYFSDKSKLGIFGRVNDFQKLDGKDKVFGLSIKGSHFAVSEDYLSKNRFALIEAPASTIILILADDGNTTVAYSLADFNADNLKNLKIENNKIVLHGKKVSWDIRDGITVEGNQKALTLIPVVSAYWFAWFSFFPQTELIK